MKTATTATITSYVSPSIFQPSVIDLPQEKLTNYFDDLFAEAWKLGERASQHMPDNGACGFAWITLTGFHDNDLDGRSKIGKALYAAEKVSLDHLNQKTLWGTSMFRGQSISAHEVACNTAINYLRVAGFTCHLGSRLD